jgi:murein DD-endopeptidase MepM/ murein hydrolase activator NlpD
MSNVAIENRPCSKYWSKHRVAKVKLFQVFTIILISAGLMFGHISISNSSPYTDAAKKQAAKSKKVNKLSNQLDGVSKAIANLIDRLDDVENHLIPQTKLDVKNYTKLAETTASEAAALKIRYNNAVKVKTKLEKDMTTASGNAVSSKNEILSIVREKIKNQAGVNQVTEIITKGSFEVFLKDLETDDLVRRNLTRIFSESKLTLSEGMNEQDKLKVITNIVETLKVKADASNKKAQEMKIKSIQKAKELKSLEAELATKKVQYEAAKVQLKKDVAAAKKEEEQAAADARRLYLKEVATGKDLGPVPVHGWLGAPLSSMYVVWGFGPRNTGIPGASTYHLGVDLRASCGQKIYAAQNGNVINAGYNGSMGNRVTISHGLHAGVVLQTQYMHMSRVATSAGAAVSKGQVIGYVGETGVAVGCHLHFGVIRNGSYVNPLGYY